MVGIGGSGGGVHLWARRARLSKLENHSQLSRYSQTHSKGVEVGKHTKPLIAWRESVPDPLTNTKLLLVFLCGVFVPKPIPGPVFRRAATVQAMHIQQSAGTFKTALKYQ